MEASCNSSDDEEPCRRRRVVQRTFSNSSAPPELTSRRDSLFGRSSGHGCDQDLQDEDHAVAIMAAAAATNLYAETEPRRRFARRNGLCQFQLLRDAVQTTIDMNSLDLTTAGHCESAYHNSQHGTGVGQDEVSQANKPQATDFSDAPFPMSSSCSSSPRRRKVVLPMIHEDTTTTTAAERRQDNYFAVTQTPSRKLSRTCFRPNPSTDTIYTEESSL